MQPGRFELSEDGAPSPHAGVPFERQKPGHAGLGPDCQKPGRYRRSRNLSDRNRIRRVWQDDEAVYLVIVEQEPVKEDRADIARRAGIERLGRREKNKSEPIIGSDLLVEHSGFEAHQSFPIVSRYVLFG